VTTNTARIAVGAVFLVACHVAGGAPADITDPPTSPPTEDTSSGALFETDSQPGGVETDTPPDTDAGPDDGAPSPDPAAGLTPPGPGGGIPMCEPPQLTTYTWPNIPVGIGYFERRTGPVSTTAAWPDGTPTTATITFNVTQDPVLAYYSAPLPGMDPLSCPPHVHIPVRVVWEISGWASGEYARYVDVGDDGYQGERFSDDDVPIDLWDTMPGVVLADRPLNLYFYGEWQHSGRFTGHVAGLLREDQYLPGENISRDYLFWDTVVP
jgi:hypothetical protein